MDPNLIIDDDYVDTVGWRCRKRGQELEELYASFIDLLTSIRDEAILDGALADALDDYIKSAGAVKDSLSKVSELIEDAADSFIGQVNLADQYLF